MDALRTLRGAVSVLGADMSHVLGKIGQDIPDSGFRPKTGRRANKLYCKLHSIPEGHHRIQYPNLPWVGRRQKPEGISARQWRKAYKRMRRELNAAALRLGAQAEGRAA